MAMTPTVGRARRRPASVSAGRAAARRVGSGVRVNARATAGRRISSAVTIAVAVPAVLGVQRHLLDEPQLVAVLEARTAAAARRLVVVDPAHQHGVDLDRA